MISHLTEGINGTSFTDFKLKESYILNTNNPIIAIRRAEEVARLGESESFFLAIGDKRAADLRRGRIIYFDLDGVIRDLSGFILESCGYPKPAQEWNFQIFGKNIFELCLAEHLRYAPPTEYAQTIWEYGETSRDIELKVQDGIYILTHQPVNWIRETINWMSEANTMCNMFTIFVESRDEKLDLLRSEDILVEDYPFDDTKCKNILRIEYPYNKSAKGYFIGSINNPDRLALTLEQLWQK